MHCMFACCAMKRMFLFFYVRTIRTKICSEYCFWFTWRKVKELLKFERVDFDKANIIKKIYLKYENF